MSYFGIFMLIFAICVLLSGLYMYTGHKIYIIKFKAPFINLSIDGWKNVGKWTMISSTIIFLIAFIALIFNI